MTWIWNLKENWQSLLVVAEVSAKPIAWELAREGCDVAICARNADALELASREIAADTARDIYPIECDTY